MLRKAPGQTAMAGFLRVVNPAPREGELADWHPQTAPGTKLPAGGQSLGERVKSQLQSGTDLGQSPNGDGLEAPERQVSQGLLPPITRGQGPKQAGGGRVGRVMPDHWNGLPVSSALDIQLRPCTSGYSQLEKSFRYFLHLSKP